MIIGYGDVASAIADREGTLFFASGVSNSNCTDTQQFKREMNLLESFATSHANHCCFYFSSMFTDTKDSPYFRHKIVMETIVKMRFENHNIIRLGNITWGSNPHTFINYLKDRIAKGMPVKIKNEYRFVIDKTHLQMLTQNLPLTGQNCLSVFTRMAKVKDLING